MDIKKLNPWNWFKHEESSEQRSVPVRQKSDRLPAYSPLLSVHQEIDQMFDNVFRSFGFPSIHSGTNSLWSGSDFLKPSIDIDATDKEYRVTAEVPGVDRKDVELEIGPDDTLIIKGEKKQEREDKDRDLYRLERTYGSFQRVLALPEDADQDRINATFKNGVLTITIARKTVAASNIRRIAIQTGGENPNSDNLSKAA